MLRIKAPQDLGAGLLFIAVGCVGLYGGSDLTYGSARNMGPGYFPMWLSWIIIGMGVICIARSLVIEGEAIEKIPLRPLFFVFAGVLLFGYLVEYIGLFLSLILMTAVATQARNDTRQKEMLILAVSMSFLAVIVFVYVLGQAMPAWWGR